MIHLWLGMLGAVACWLLFRNPARLGDVPPVRGGVGVSVIIPARNEEKNLPLLLADLAAGELGPVETIVVDDMSLDGTAEAALAGGARLVRVKEKPAGWTGKSYACHVGAKAARGEALVFLDADVRLSADGLARLVGAWRQEGQTVAVQPYHEPQCWFEQGALFFNLVAVAAMMARLPGKRTPGLFGPAIVISRDVYEQVGGHEAVKGCVVEDLSLGVQLDACGQGYTRLLGGEAVRFRMYSEGPGQVAEGFIKNFANGAGGTAPLPLLLTVLWIAALVRAPMGIAEGIFATGWGMLLAYLGLYLLLAALLWWATVKVGDFWPGVVAGYPVALVFFIVVFFVSILKKLLRRPVTWKGRNVEMDGGG